MAFEQSAGAIPRNLVGWSLVCPEERGKVEFGMTLFPSNPREMHSEALRWPEIQALTVSAYLAESAQ